MHIGVGATGGGIRRCCFPGTAHLRHAAMSLDLVEELRHEIAAGRVTCIVGAGVSIAASYDPARKPNVASWLGLLEHGIAHCTAVVPGLPAKWAPSMRSLIELGKDGDTNALLSVADNIFSRLDAPRGGEFRRWLRETVGELRILHPEVPQALGALGTALLTTNYDSILEEATHLPTCTWRDTSEVERVLRGEERAIVHLHGYWRRPESIILGTRSYEEILGDSHAQTVLRALRMTKTLLFVGFGAGLDDPNFGALLRWTREVFRESEVRHFRLARADEVDALSIGHPRPERIFVLPYGAKHDDLGPFLASLAPAKKESASPHHSISPSSPPRPRVLVAGPFFGVSAELQAEINRIWRNEPREEAMARIQAKLRRSEIRHAQIAAILRHDVIVDLSPWRAFSGHWSLGLRDLERDPPHDGPPVPLLFLAGPAGELPPADEAAPAGLNARLRALREHYADLATRIDELADIGLLLAGFDPLTALWCKPLLEQWPKTPLIVDRDLGAALGDRHTVRAIEPADAPLRDPSLDDYLHALRVVAGQVILPGEAIPRPIRDVYVEMEVQREVERRRDPDSGQREEGSEDDGATDHDAFRDEVEARRRAEWDLATGEVLPASTIHEIGRRVLLWGPAGTGKSTLLRCLACKTADEGRVPVWVPRLVDFSDDFADTLAMQALQAVGLPEGPSSARSNLREAVESGRAFIFLDGFDEAPPGVRASLPERIATLPPDLRVVLASRPLRRIHTDLVEVTLGGLPATGAEGMLRSYFGNEAWIAPLLHELGALPDGTAWKRTPVLLGLAAALYRRDRALPDATLDLYARVLEHLLERLPAPWRTLEIRRELARLARRMLLPETGAPVITIREGSLPYDRREAFLASGLFTGDEWLRFTHLTFGEYLAAQSELDLRKERERERARAEGRPNEDNTLDVLPIAHARQGKAALDDALRDACTCETSGHHMLRLLLRAIGYGGEGVQAFCEERGQEVLSLLVTRMQDPGGRFGDYERLLMADSERALMILRPFVNAEMGSILEGQLRRVLATPGEAGTEAHIVLWNLGLRAPDRRSSRWWPTIERQARALVRAGVSVDHLLALTSRMSLVDQDKAVAILGKYSEYWPRLRQMINSRHDQARINAIDVLADDPGSIPYIRERLHDDEARVRLAAINALARDPKRRAAHLECLIACMDDPDGIVRHAAVRHLRNEKEARNKIRELARRLLRWHHSESRDEAIQILADEPESSELVREFIEHTATYYSSAMPYLARHPHWRHATQARIYSDNPDPQVIRVFTADTEHGPRLRELLNHPVNLVRAAAVEALASDPSARPLILALLNKQDEDANVRAACTKAIGHDLTVKDEILRLLQDPDEAVRSEAIDALGKDESAVNAIIPSLEDREHNPRVHAVRALARHPSRTRSCLWDYFWKNIDHDFKDGIWLDLIRTELLLQLQHDHESKSQIIKALSDRVPRVRAAAIKALSGPGAPRDTFRSLLDDTDSSVRAAAFKALADEPNVQERLIGALNRDERPLRIAGFRLLVQQTASRNQIRELLRNGPARIRSSTVQPLAYDPDSRALLHECVLDRNIDVRDTVIAVLHRDPEVRRRVRNSFYSDATVWNSYHFMSDTAWSRVLEVLADDPAAHPILLDMVTASKDHNFVAAIAPALSHFPKAREYLRSLLRDSNAYTNIRAAAALALAGDSEVRADLESLLDHKEADVRAASVQALADVLEARERLRALLSDPHKTVRQAAIDALASDPGSRELLRQRLGAEEEDEIRANLIAILSSDPDSMPLLRAQLSALSSRVRIRAARALSPNPVVPGQPLERLPALRLALRMAGKDPSPLAPLPPPELQDRLDAFVKTPTSINLDRDPAFAEALLGWVCARLAWAAPDGAFRGGQAFGEVETPVESLLALDAGLVIRVSMDSSDLPRERFLHPLHNLIEAWHVAKHLSSAHPPAFFLACADVGFEHLAPPILEPGDVRWGPIFFGFRLRKDEAAPLDPSPVP